MLIWRLKNQVIPLKAARRRYRERCFEWLWCREGLEEKEKEREKERREREEGRRPTARVYEERPLSLKISAGSYHASTSRYSPKAI
jgi:hypothetical protein